MNIALKKKAEKHEFAFYVPTLSGLIKNVIDETECSIDDEMLQQRLDKVVRLQVGDSVILFDDVIHAFCIIKQFVGKRRLIFILKSKHRNKPSLPSVMCVLPLLKKDDFESAIYLLAELGVTTIQLVATEKVTRVWGKEKEFERLSRITIAAAEQSKSFFIPQIKPPVSLEQLLVSIKNVGTKAVRIFFDPEGKPLLYFLNKYVDDRESFFVLMVGPEGDLTGHEKKMIKDAAFEFCVLTPTTLKAVHALCLGVGAFKSL